MAAGNGYCSQNSLRQHFGLGEFQRVDSLVVTWPSGRRENFGPLSVNAHHLLQEGSGAISTGVSGNVGTVPSRFDLGPPFPNPFNGAVVIPYSVPGEAAVEITVVDVRGRTIQVLVHGRPGPGAHRVAWRGGENASGLYLIRMSAGSRQFVRKILFLR
ncbi:MAG: ASPIC/UnbV domain-containing protein [Fidelibacterota bacterium]